MLIERRNQTVSQRDTLEIGFSLDGPVQTAYPGDESTKSFTFLEGPVGYGQRLLASAVFVMYSIGRPLGSFQTSSDSSPLGYINSSETSPFLVEPSHVFGSWSSTMMVNVIRHGRQSVV